MAGVPSRLGILGGTFDPIHIGHLVAAVCVRHDLRLDRVLLVVANEPWQKVGTRTLTPAHDRLALVQAAVAGVEGVEGSDLEIRRGGPTYTADTLAELQRENAEAELYLVVGSDVAADLHTWERVDEVRRAATLAVVGRPGSPAEGDRLRAEGWRVEEVTIPALDVSSTELRQRAAAGLPIEFLVPDAALREIAQRGLYAAPR